MSEVAEQTGVGENKESALSKAASGDSQPDRKVLRLDDEEVDALEKLLKVYGKHNNHNMKIEKVASRMGVRAQLLSACQKHSDPDVQLAAWECIQLIPEEKRDFYEERGISFSKSKPSKGVVGLLKSLVKK